MLLIPRQEKIHGLVKPLLPKPSAKPLVINTIVIPLVSLRIACVYSINAIIVLFQVSCYTGSTACTYYKMYLFVNCFIAKLYTVYTNDYKYNKA